MERSIRPVEREGVYSPIGAWRRREARTQNAAVCESADSGVSLGSQLNQARLETFTRVPFQERGHVHRGGAESAEVSQRGIGGLSSHSLLLSLRRLCVLCDSAMN